MNQANVLVVGNKHDEEVKNVEGLKGRIPGNVTAEELN